MLMAEEFIRQIQITGLTKEEPFFMQLKILFQSGEGKIIRVQLDKFTYWHLRKVVFPDHFSTESSYAVCFIPASPGLNKTKAGTEWIDWEILGQKKRLSYLCSKEYFSFISKLRRIQCIKEFHEIVSPAEKVTTEETDEATEKAPKSLPHPLLRYIYTTLIFIFCLFAASYTILLGDQPDKGHSEKLVVAAIAEEEFPLPEKNIDNKGKQDEVKEELSVPKELIKSLPEGQIALTFDDGPSKYTQDILGVLEEYGVQATFFFLGQNIACFPEAVIQVRDQGHGIGLHSFSHPVMRGLSLEEQEQEVESSIEALRPYLDEVFLFRPPYGIYDQNTKTALSAYNMSLVLWNRDPRDWQVSSPEEIVDAVLNTAFSGGIYLLHEDDLTLEALPQIIEAFQEEGLEFVNLGHKENVFTVLSVAQIETIFESRY